MEGLRRIGQALFVVSDNGAPALGLDGAGHIGERPLDGDYPLLAFVPGLDPANLGDASFCRDHGIRAAYVAGAMANGIASEELVEAMAGAGLLSFFGSAGLSVERVSAAIDRLEKSVHGKPYGFNLIHSPNESELEAKVVDLYIRRGIRLVEASAYLRLTAAVVRFRVHGIHRGADGRVVTPNRIVAKVSRTEVASRFFAPPPEKLLDELVQSGAITAEQAALAQEIPMAQDVTAEADSGGHTDNRPAIALLPTLCALRDRFQQEHGYAQRLRVGLGGGISTPASAAAAFAMGAAYIVTGSVNQSCREAGTSDIVRQMLAEAGQADVAMAPAADMFEMGVEVQVLKRGTMFSMRGHKLYELYRGHKTIDTIPADEREKLEKTFFRMPLDEVWKQTSEFFAKRDPRQLERAERDPRHKMALMFRSYLGQASRWANAGVADRQVDYQVWCGPAMGAFNEWVKGSFLEDWRDRHVATIAENILYGAAVLARVNQLRSQGVPVPVEAERIEPMTMDALSERMRLD